MIDLNGIWYIKHDTDDSFEEDGMPYNEDFLPHDWQKIRVPSHWHIEGYDYQGIVWYYNEFKLNIDLYKDIEKIFINFEGVDYLAQVWLNGVYLGEHEGDFDSFQFEISSILKDENKLFVKVESSVDSRPEFKEILKGGIYHWDCLPIEQRGLDDCPEVPSASNSRYPNPVINPGGIWKSVFLGKDRPYQLKGIKVTPQFINGQEKVYLYVQGEVFNWTEDRVKFKGELVLKPDNFSGDRYEHSFLVDMKPGGNYFNEVIELDKPALWWTWDLGQPNLYRLNLNYYFHDEKEVQYEELVGIREVKKGDNWELYLNGERFFARGANYLSDQFLSKSTPELYDQDLKLMLDANMNMIRIFSHMENEYFYKQCDLRGLLIWQDLPFQWGYETGPYLIKRARDITKRFIKKLYNHPCIFLWCCHSESRFHDYNKLDRIIDQEVKKIDPHRPVWRNSVIMTAGNPPEYFSDLEIFENYIKHHLSVHWVGWYWGEVADAEYYNPLFVTEFGTQSVPDKNSLDKFISGKYLWPPNWDVWHYHGFQTDVYQKNLGQFPDRLEELIQITQDYQCRFYKQHIEALRRKKYKNVNGLLQFHFVNTWPAIDWSIIDYYRKPKKAYYMIKQVFNPVLLSFTGQFSDKNVNISLWVINDLKNDFNNLNLEWEVLVGDKKIFEDVVKLDKIEADSSRIYLERELEIDCSEVEVRGKLFDGSEVLNSNQNLLIPQKDFTDNIETLDVL